MAILAAGPTQRAVWRWYLEFAVIIAVVLVIVGSAGFQPSVMLTSLIVVAGWTGATRLHQMRVRVATGLPPCSAWERATYLRPIGSATAGSHHHGNNASTSRGRKMWVKTRVGLTQLVEPVDIRVGKYPAAPEPNWAVFAQLPREPVFRYKGWFGSGTSQPPFVWLAMFKISETTEAEIAHCFSLIEETIRSQAMICDLSEVGDTNAWGPNWTFLRWA